MDKNKHCSYVWCTVRYNCYNSARSFAALRIRFCSGSSKMKDQATEAALLANMTLKDCPASRIE